MGEYQARISFPVTSVASIFIRLFVLPPMVVSRIGALHVARLKEPFAPRCYAPRRITRSEKPHRGRPVTALVACSRRRTIRPQPLRDSRRHVLVLTPSPLSCREVHTNKLFFFQNTHHASTNFIVLFQQTRNAPALCRYVDRQVYV